MTPELIHLYDLEESVVVVVDILRATSCMTTAFAHGVHEIIPVATLKECQLYQDQGFLCAAERGGQKVEGFTLDNSPFSYMTPAIDGETIVVTTTNGTLAITKSKSAFLVLIGSFLNISSVARIIKSKKRNVIIHCAGWKGRVNMEDSLYAGALLHLLADTYDMSCDAAHLTMGYYHAMHNDLTSVIKSSSHAQRPKKFNIERDIEFCLKEDEYDVVPYLKGDRLIEYPD